MSKIYKNSLFYVVILSYVCLSLSSCVSPKTILYFQDFPSVVDSPLTVTPTIHFEDPTIENNDNLAIFIRTIIPSSETPIVDNNNATFNQYNGYLVDKNGYIELPLVGFVKMAGLTTTEARELIKQKAKEFFKDPVVSVRIANFDITVLGAIMHVGTITAINEKISILDVIAQVGGIPPDARMDNILLIRHVNDENKIIRYDMRSSNILKSPYFYLKQHDIVYVQPTDFKIQNSGNVFIKYVGILSSVVSLISIAFLIKNAFK